MTANVFVRVDDNIVELNGARMGSIPIMVKVIRCSFDRIHLSERFVSFERHDT